jgi:hypothetical protein
MPHVGFVQSLFVIISRLRDHALLVLCDLFFLLIHVYIKVVLRHRNSRNSPLVRFRVIATSRAICRPRNPGNRKWISNIREMFEERDIASKASNIIIPNCISKP